MKGNTVLIAVAVGLFAAAVSVGRGVVLHRHGGDDTVPYPPPPTVCVTSG